MNRLLRAAAALVCAAGLSAFASTSNVTATLTDSDGTAWANCAWSAVVSSPTPPTISGVPVPDAQLRANGSCNGSGTLSATMLDTSSVDQRGVTWTFTITPNASVQPSVVSGVAVSGASVNLSTNLSSGIKAPRFNPGPKAYGYADAEVNAPTLGDTYFNTAGGCGSASLRQFSNAGWQCGGDLPYISPKVGFGAYVDAQKVNDCTVTSGSTTVTCATAHFAAGDVGKTIGIPYAGPNNGTQTVTATLVTTIASVTDGSTIVLTDAPVTTIPGPRTVTDWACAKYSGNCTSATAAFVAGDVGKKINIPGAGLPAASGNVQPTEIATVTSGTAITTQRLSMATISAQTVNIPGAIIIWGHDDTAALQSAIDAGCSTHRTVLLDAGRYLTTASLVPCNGLTVQGQGAGVSTISPVGADYAAFRLNSTYANPLKNVSYLDLEMDLSGVRTDNYDAIDKAIYTTFNQNLTVRNTYIHDCAATCIGTDFNVNSKFIHNVVAYGGDQVAQFGGGGGGACIGLGTGQYATESQIIEGNIVSDCGAHGIFVESQSSGTLSAGIVIANNYVGYSGLGTSVGDGIGDHSTRGTTIVGNFVEQSQVGINMFKGFVNGYYSTDYHYESNTLIGNAVGISITAQNGGGKISNNLIEGNNGIGLTGINNSGLRISPAGGTPTTIEISNNQIWGMTYCIQLLASGSNALGDLQVTDNQIWNCGSTGAPRPALDTNVATVANLNFRNNSVFNLTGGQTNYGVVVESGATVTRLYTAGNDVSRTTTGTLLNNLGTVTAQAGGFSGSCDAGSGFDVSDGVITGCTAP